MTTSLQQLLEALTAKAIEPEAAATVEDAAGALAHLGRALTRLTDDGLTPGDSLRQRIGVEAAEAVTVAGQLWPHTGGPLTDLAGAAADLIGRDRFELGRSHRWAIAVEVTEASDHLARLSRRLLPQAAVAEMIAVQRLAAAIEHQAQADPPTSAGASVLDRLVPSPDSPPGISEVTALNASAALLAAMHRAQRTGVLTIRDFRAAVAAAEITSASAAVVLQASAGEEVDRQAEAVLAWQLAGRASTLFDDGQRAGPADSRGVVSAAQALVRALHTDVGHPAAAADSPDPRDWARATRVVQPVTWQIPAVADQLLSAVERWSRNGQLFVPARELPPVEKMPESRVDAVIAGRHVRATGADLNGLRQAVERAGAATGELFDRLDQAIIEGQLANSLSMDQQAGKPQTPKMANRLVDRAQTMEYGPITVWSSHPAAPDAPTL